MKRWLLCLRVERRSVSHVDCLLVNCGQAICKPCSLLNVFVRCIHYDGILCHEFTQVCLHLSLHVSRCLSMIEVRCRVQCVPALFTRLLCSRVWYIFRFICRDELYRSLAPHGEEPGVSTLGVGGLSLGEVGGCGSAHLCSGLRPARVGHSNVRISRCAGTAEYIVYATSRLCD